jgi:hypothetical protein
MKKIINILALFSMLLGIVACETMKEPETEYSSTFPVSGEWWVTYSLNGKEVQGFTKLITSNTAANDGKAIWIDDVGKFWNFKVKCPVNMSNLSFAGDNLVSTAIDKGAAYDIKVDITNGKVIKNGGFSTSGVVTDSIYFEAEFEDDLGSKYVIAGTRKTGFAEDEH